MAEFSYNSKMGSANTLATQGGIRGSHSEPMESNPMEDQHFRASVKSCIDDAVDYIDGYIAPIRAKTIKYYRGDPFGNEEEGRSQIVMTDVRDTVLAMVPSILRIFTASEQIVEFAPRNAQSVDMAEQATDYVNLIFYNDNPGFSILYSYLKDGLTSATGVMKWRWSENETITEAEYSRLDDMQVQALKMDPEVEILEETPSDEPEQPAMPGQPPAPPPTDLRIRRRIEKNRVVVEALPPEEFLIAREATDIESAAYVGHRALKTASELVSMGYDKDEIESNSGATDVFALNYELQNRNPSIMSFMNHADNPDPAMKRVLYVESYIRIDKDGDGIAELRKVCSLGQAHYILHDEIVDEAPFAYFCPDPEPHMVIGKSMADQTMDLQLIKSNIVRNTLDSLSQTIVPRLVVVEGQVNLDDAMNTEIGGLIRAKQVGAVQALSQPFVGQQAMPVLEYMDAIKANRTGVTPQSQGLDADAIQSSSTAGVKQIIQGGQERIELVARLAAENGLKRLFRGILRLVCRHQDKPRIVKMRGKYVEVNPRYWDSDLDVMINVGLGHGTDQDKIQALMLMATKQEQIIMSQGLNNPICGPVEYRNTLAQIAQLAGFKDAQRYFKAVDPQAVAQQANQPPKPDPNMMLVQIEQQKVQGELQIKQAQLQLSIQEAQMKDAREKEKNRGALMLGLAEIEAKYKTQIDSANIEAMVSRDTMLADALNQLHATNTGAQVDHAGNQMQAGVDHASNVMGAAVDHAGNQMQAAAQPKAVQ